MLELDTENLLHIENKAHVNLTIKELVDFALAREEGVLASNQALTVRTGTRTGRSPKDRFIVKDDITARTVEWNHINQAISPEQFSALWKKAVQYLELKKNHFVSYLSVGADPNYSLPVKVISELAWHNLFAYLLCIRPENLSNTASPNQWTILSTPGYKTDGQKDGVNSDAAVLINFTQRRILICGTYYAGEMKKALFSVLNFLLPELNVLPMHCAANTGEDENDTVLFFGLSGTGKTTLSSDPERFLIGDDEHGWSESIVFNFEGGCYAKCMNLSSDKEPIIWKALRFGSIMENVILDPKTTHPIFSDSSLTQNTRAAYPREYVFPRVEANLAGQPKAIIFLSCDLYGVLPPVARLTNEQAIYYFLSGYTALIGSTEDSKDKAIQPIFSPCFGAPFFPRPAEVYADLLLQRLQAHKTEVYLVNTGWTGGSYGQGGHRFSIPTSRAIIRAIVNGQLRHTNYSKLSLFNFDIPDEVPHIDPHMLNPRATWNDPLAYDRCAQELINQFAEHFQKFSVSDEIKKAGPMA